MSTRPRSTRDDFKLFLEYLAVFGHEQPELTSIELDGATYEVRMAKMQGYHSDVPVFFCRVRVVENGDSQQVCQYTSYKEPSGATHFRIIAADSSFFALLDRIRVAMGVEE